MLRKCEECGHVKTYNQEVIDEENGGEDLDICHRCGGMVGLVGFVPNGPGYGTAQECVMDKKLIEKPVIKERGRR